VVAKGDVHARERAFYERVTIAGVRAPRHLGTVEVERTWLLLEHLPDPLPRSRWGADGEVLEVLHAVHVADKDLIAAVPTPFRPSWPEAMDAAARDVLELSDEAGAALAGVREAAQPLFEPVGVISGDANPLNWRLDATGRPVLLDWERVGLGHPAIDLATSMPGLPTGVEATSLATAYGAHGGEAVTADEVLVAKAWSVVEFAAEAAAQPRLLGAVAQLRPELDQWLVELSAPG
jgi:hypothetical protein